MKDQPVTILDFGKIVEDVRTGYKGELESFEIQNGKTVARYGAQIADPQYLRLAQS
jgi:hypothetical protein